LLLYSSIPSNFPTLNNAPSWVTQEPVVESTRIQKSETRKICFTQWKTSFFFFTISKLTQSIYCEAWSHHTTYQSIWRYNKPLQMILFKQNASSPNSSSTRLNRTGLLEGESKRIIFPSKTGIRFKDDQCVKHHWTLAHYMWIMEASLFLISTLFLSHLMKYYRAIFLYNQRTWQYIY
jgi:hypothetical protein